MQKIVCRCRGVRVADIKEFCNTYPNMSKDQVKLAMNIGRTCGSCNYKDSPVIDIHFNELFENNTKIF